MNCEQQALLLANCMLNAIAAANPTYPVAVAAMAHSLVTLIAARVGDNGEQALSEFDIFIKAVAVEMKNRYGPRTDPSMN